MIGRRSTHAEGRLVQCSCRLRPRRQQNKNVSRVSTCPLSKDGSQLSTKIQSSIHLHGLYRYLSFFLTAHRRTLEECYQCSTRSQHMKFSSDYIHATRVPSVNRGEKSSIVDVGSGAFAGSGEGFFFRSTQLFDVSSE